MCAHIATWCISDNIDRRATEIGLNLTAKVLREAVDIDRSVPSPPEGLHPFDKNLQSPAGMLLQTSPYDFVPQIEHVQWESKFVETYNCALVGGIVFRPRRDPARRVTAEVEQVFLVQLTGRPIPENIEVPVQDLLQYVLYLFQDGISLSSVRYDLEGGKFGLVQDLV